MRRSNFIRSIAATGLGAAIAIMTHTAQAQDICKPYFRVGEGLGPAWHAQFAAVSRWKSEVAMHDGPGWTLPCNPRMFCRPWRYGGVRCIYRARPGTLG
jgi:hypothetical protein